jgi:DNA (cytosine-5)-methyltransferase 3A
MNILSLFDGISCAQIALQRAGVQYDNYFASEVNKYAIAITQRHYPATMQIGCVKRIQSMYLPNIDLLVGGSPCQGFSFAGKQLNFKDPRSALFFQYVKLLKELKPKYFLFENVLMKREFINIISNQLGVTPVKINSSLVSAQRRSRLYWANFKINQPKDRGVLLGDVFIDGKDITNKIWKDTRGAVGNAFAIKKIVTLSDKSYCLTATGQKITNRGATNVKIGSKYYSLGIKTCERLQTLKDNYTKVIVNNKIISDHIRHSLIGNSFTVDVIAHIFKELK